MNSIQSQLKNSAVERIAARPIHEIANSLIRAHIAQRTLPEDAKLLRYLKTIAPVSTPENFARLCEDLLTEFRLNGSTIWKQLSEWMLEAPSAVPPPVTAMLLSTLKEHSIQLELSTTAQLLTELVRHLKLGNLDQVRVFEGVIAAKYPEKDLQNELLYIIKGMSGEHLYSRKGLDIIIKAEAVQVGGPWSAAKVLRPLAECALFGLKHEFTKIAEYATPWNLPDYAAFEAELTRERTRIFPVLPRQAVRSLTSDSRESTSSDSGIDKISPRGNPHSPTLVRDWSSLLAKSTGNRASDEQLILSEVMTGSEHERRSFLARMDSGEVRPTQIHFESADQLLLSSARDAAMRGDLSILSSLADHYQKFVVVPSSHRFKADRLARVILKCSPPQMRLVIESYFKLREARETEKDPKLLFSKMLSIYDSLASKASIKARAQFIELSGIHRTQKFWTALIVRAARAGDITSLHWIYPILQQHQVPLTSKQIVYTANAFQRAQHFGEGVAFLSRYKRQFSADGRVVYAELLRKAKDYVGAILEANRVIHSNVGRDDKLHALNVRAYSAFHAHSENYRDYLNEACREIDRGSRHWLSLQCLRVFSNDRSLDPRSSEASELLVEFIQILNSRCVLNSRLLEDIGGAYRYLLERRSFALAHD